jgi:hypothetical protein
MYAMPMNVQVKELLHSFDALPQCDQRIFAFEILRRTIRFDLPPLEDDDLVYHAEELFLALEREEASNA